MKKKKTEEWNLKDRIKNKLKLESVIYNLAAQKNN